MRARTDEGQARHHGGVVLAGQLVVAGRQGRRAGGAIRWRGLCQSPPPLFCQPWLAAPLLCAVA